MLNKEISMLFIQYANYIAETVQYNLSDSYARSFVNDRTANFLKKLSKEIDFNHMTKEDAENLGFMPWNTNRNGIIYLIPLYLISVIPTGTDLISIFDEHIIYDGHNIDLDNRFGCLAYGIKLE